MEDRRSIAKKAAIGVALVIAAAGAVLFYKNNIAMNPGDTLLKYMSYAEDGKYEKMYDLLNEESQKSISKEEFIKRNKNIYKGQFSALFLQDKKTLFKICPYRY